MTNPNSNGHGESEPSTTYRHVDGDTWEEETSDGDLSLTDSQAIKDSLDDEDESSDDRN